MLAVQLVVQKVKILLFVGESARVDLLILFGGRKLSKG